MVTHVEFDRGRPPPDMPSTGVDGSGVCKNVFEIEASIESSVEMLSPTIVRVYPENFDVITRLKVTIYTEKGRRRSCSLTRKVIARSASTTTAMPMPPLAPRHSP